MNRLDKNAVSSTVLQVTNLQFENQFSGDNRPETDLNSSVFLPMHYEKGYAYPLIVWLSGSNSRKLRISSIMPRISLRNYVGLGPAESGFASASPMDEFDGENFGSNSGEIEGVDLNSFLDEEFADEEADDSEVNYEVNGEYSENDFEMGRPSNLSSTNSGSKDPGSKDPGFKDFGAGESSDEVVDDEKIFEAISSIQRRYNIASDKVFIAGCGSGGRKATSLAIRHPHLFAGVITLGGSLPDSKPVFGDLRSSRKLPVFIGQSRDDPFFPEDDLCQDLKMLHVAGFSVTARQYPGDQSLHDQMFHDIDVWVMEIINGFDMTKTDKPVAESN